MKAALFAMVVSCETLLGAGLLASFWHPGQRVWPPPGRRSWQYWSTWILTDLAIGGILALGILDWNGFAVPPWLRAVGAALLGAGLLFAWWAVRTLSFHASLGLGGAFVTRGPYRISRNPQYVGDIAALLGYALLSNSAITLAAAVIGSFWFAFAPLVEEPWLRARYGAAYDQYCFTVPRFLGRPRRAGPRETPGASGP